VDYQHLRSSSSSFVDHLVGKDFELESLATAAEAMIVRLAKLCGNDTTQDMKDDAMGIFKDARDFEIQLRKLKAVYRFHMCTSVAGTGKSNYGMSFNDEKMTDRSPSRNDKNDLEVLEVDFIMSPGLHKRGNNDGEKYENDTWLIKMGVVCNAARFFSKPEPCINTGKAPVQIQGTFGSGGIEGQDTKSQCQASAADAGNKAETPIEIKDADSGDEADPLSIAGPAHCWPAPTAHDSNKTQSNTAIGAVTRSQAHRANIRTGETGVTQSGSNNSDFIEH
jgi:hypothetical protein